MFAPEEMVRAHPYRGIENDIWHLVCSVASVLTGGHPLYFNKKDMIYFKEITKNSRWLIIWREKIIQNSNYFNYFLLFLLYFLTIILWYNSLLNFVSSLSAKNALEHPFFWSHTDKVNFLTIANNEFHIKAVFLHLWMMWGKLRWGWCLMCHGFRN